MNHRMNNIKLNTQSVLNSGDAAIVLGQVGLLRELFGDPRITVTSRTPENDRAFYGRLGVQVLPPLFPTPSVFGSRSAKITGCARGLVAVRAKRRLLAELRCADLVISSGGGYFFSTRRLLPGPMFWQAFLQVRLAQRLRKPVVLAPQSFGPFANRIAFRSMRRLLTHDTVRKILVREPNSLRLVADLVAGTPSQDRVWLCPDLAFLLEPAAVGVEDAPRPGPGPPLLAVTVRDWLFPDRHGAAARAEARKNYVAAVAAACAWFHQRFSGALKVVAQARGPGRLEDDRGISLELVTALRASVPESHVEIADLREDAPPETVIAAIGRADLLLASRFHSAILAMTAGRPAVVLGYQPKSEGMMRMLGLERFCLPMDGLEASDLFPLFDEVMADPARFVAEHVRPGVAAMRVEIRTRMRGALESLLPA
jgi:colanic acid/amylovoran biosynthesis protein